MEYVYKAFQFFKWFMYILLGIPLFYYLGGIALSLAGHLLFLVLWTIGDIIYFLFTGPPEWHITSKEWMSEFFATLWGDTVYGIQKIWELITSNYSLLLGLAIAGYFVRDALLKIYPKKAADDPVFKGPGIPAKPISATFFDSAQLKHDREGNPYVAVGILTDAVNENAYYMAFYHRNRKLRFVSVRDELPYELTGLSPIMKRLMRQIEKEAAPLRLKAQATLNSYPFS